MPSKIQVDFIATAQNTATTLTQGATIPSGKTISGDGNMIVSGVLSATSFVGNASGITNVFFATTPKTIALSFIGG